MIQKQVVAIDLLMDGEVSGGADRGLQEMMISLPNRVELSTISRVGWRKESAMTDKLALLQRQVHQGQPHYRPATPTAAAQAPSAAQQQQPQASHPDNASTDSGER